MFNCNNVPCASPGGMKQGTNFQMPVTISGIEDLSTVESIEFLFKRLSSKSQHSFKTAYYAADGSGDVILSENVFYIPWTRAETYTVPSGSTFYMDTRIHLADTDDNPPTNIVELTMNPTLFDVNEEVTGG